MDWAHRGYATIPPPLGDCQLWNSAFQQILFKSPLMVSDHDDMLESTGDQQHDKKPVIE